MQPHWSSYYLFYAFQSCAHSELHTLDICVILPPSFVLIVPELQSETLNFAYIPRLEPYRILRLFHVKFRPANMLILFCSRGILLCSPLTRCFRIVSCELSDSLLYCQVCHRSLCFKFTLLIRKPFLTYHSEQTYLSLIENFQQPEL